MKIRIEPYKTWSGGAKALGIRAGILRATQRQVKKHGDFDIIINWGRSEKRFQGTYLNDPEKVLLASNKAASMEILAEAEVPVPDFTADQTVAQAWWEDKDVVVARKLLRANSGRGIVLCSAEDDTPVVPAPLYTKYIKKAEEYRVHVFDGNVIDVQQKRKRQEIDNEDVDYRIRNAGNGWVYCRGGVEPPDGVIDASIRAVGALGLDFGAVDIGWNNHHGAACVYEVNTAPGLEGTTLDKYFDALVAKYPVLKGGRYNLRRTA